MPSTRQLASRQTAKAVGRMSSRLSPLASRSFNAGVMACSSASVFAAISGSRAATASAMGRMRLSSLSEKEPNSLSIKDIVSLTF